MQSRQMSENYVNATLSDLNDLTNAILSNPDVQSTLETKPELRQIAKSAVDRPVITKDSRTWNGRQTMISYGPLNEGQWTLLQKSISPCCLRMRGKLVPGPSGLFDCIDAGLDGVLSAK